MTREEPPGRFRTYLRQGDENTTTGPVSERAPLTPATPVTTLAVTGHTDLTEDSVPLVRAALDDLLRRHGTRGALAGVSCIAEGADSVFAEAVLAAGGRLTVVVPSRDYRRTKVGPGHAARFDHLVEAAHEVVVLPRERADRQAYEAANAVLVERADHLVAVWNGEPPGGKGGGTADAVLDARAAGVPVEVVWPQGVRRRQALPVDTLGRHDPHH